MQMLLHLPTPALVRPITAALGAIRWAVRASQRRRVISYYQAMSRLARHHAPGSALAVTPAAELARRYFTTRAFLDVIPPIITRGSDRYIDRLAVMPGLHALRQTADQGRGLVIMGTHTGTMGISPAMLLRHGFRVMILRDQQFARYLGTAHESAFFLGAEPVFLDENQPASVNAALLKCAKALRQGAVIAFTGDAGHGTRTRTVRVFGQPLPIRTALIELAMRVGCPVAFAFSRPAGGSVALDLYPPRLLTGESDLTEWLDLFARTWQRYLADHPECFAWQEAELMLADAGKREMH